MNKNKADLVSFLSKERINSLKKKLERKNEDCPISTLSQLMKPPTSLVKPQALRSLKTKSSQPQHPSENLTVANEQLVPGSSLSAESFNSQPLGDITNQDNPLPTSRSDEVFAVPTMRAPRAAKANTTEAVNKCIEAATFAWCNLDKEIAERLFYLMNVYILGQIEKLSPDTSNSANGSQNDIMAEINDFMERLALGNKQPNSERQQSRMDFLEADNMSSVSGFQPYRGNFGYQNFHPQDFRRQIPGIGRSYEPSVVGSVLDDYAYADRMSTVSSVRSRLVPSFVKMQLENSIAPSMYQPRYYSFMQQADQMSTVSGRDQFLPGVQNSRFNNYAGSSFLLPRRDSVMNQTHFRPHGMQEQTLYQLKSVRQDAPIPLRPPNGNTTAFSTMVNHSDNHQMNQADTLRRNQRIIGNTFNGGVRGNYCGDTDQSRCSQENLEPLRRKVQAPLEPQVIIKRLEPNECHENDPDFDCSPRRPVTKFNYPRARPCQLEPSNTSSHLSKQVENIVIATPNINILRKRCTTTVTVAPSDRINQSPGNRTRRLDSTITRSGRVVHPPQHSSGNTTSRLDSTITRSGRVVRPPQHFWENRS